MPLKGCATPISIHSRLCHTSGASHTKELGYPRDPVHALLPLLRPGLRLKDRNEPRTAPFPIPLQCCAIPYTYTCLYSVTIVAHLLKQQSVRSYLLSLDLLHSISLYPLLPASIFGHTLPQAEISTKHEVDNTLYTHANSFLLFCFRIRTALFKVPPDLEALRTTGRRLVAGSTTFDPLHPQILNSRIRSTYTICSRIHPLHCMPPSRSYE